MQIQPGQTWETSDARGYAVVQITRLHCEDGWHVGYRFLLCTDTDYLSQLGPDAYDKEWWAPEDMFLAHYKLEKHRPTVYERLLGDKWLDNE